MFIIRFIGYLILAIFAISILRSFIGVIGRLFSTYALGEGGKSPRRAQGGAQRTPVGGVLRRDPVCGTYVSEAVSLKLNRGTETLHFCSPKCLQDFQSRAG